MRVLADESRVGDLIEALASSIEQSMSGSPRCSELARPGRADSAGWALVGVRRRGDVLARRLAELLGPQRLEGRAGGLDITLYRDDLSEIGPQPVVRTTDLAFNLDGLDVVLVDDVLMTGRSIRAALGSLMDLGRPRRVWLSVLVDRGGREVPISPDHVALDLAGGAEQLAPGEHVQVLLRPTDPRDAITVQAEGE